MAAGLTDAEVFGSPAGLTDAQVFGSPLAIRDKPVDDPPLPTGSEYGGSEYGDIGPGASFNQGPQPTPAQQPTAAVAPPSLVLDDYGRPVDKPPDMSGVATAVKEGWQGSPSFWTSPQARQQVADLPVVGPLLAPAGDIIGGLFGAGSAAVRGAQEAVKEAVSPVSPSLARDLAAFPEAFPFGFGETGGFKLPEPESMQAARDKLGRKLTVQEITDAIKRSDLNAQVEQNQLMPGEAPPPSGPAPSQQPLPQTDTTGLAAGVGGMGSAISDSLRDHLWSQLQKGDLTEAGAPSTILQAAKAQVDSGAIKTRADFDQFYQNYGDQLRAQRTGTQQPTPQPDAAAATPQPEPATGATAPDNAWVGSTVDQVHDLVQQNAAQGGPASLNAAATPEQLAAMSPNMAKAYRRMAEVNRVVSPIEGENSSIIVPGSVPTKAEAMGSPEISQQERLIQERQPDAYTGPNGRLTKSNTARLQLYDDMTPSDPQIQTIREDQAKQAKADTALVNQNAGPVDGAPVAAQLKQLLSDPRITEQPDIVKTLQPIHDALYDADGNLKTDIQSYWGMHDNLMTKLAKAKDPLNASSSEKFAFNQLVDAKNAIDDAMSKASGGAFQTFLDNQRAFFQRLNAATILRDFRSKPGMINPKTGYIQPNAFHRFVTDMAVRRGRPGIDPAMDVPDDVFGKLMDINDDLKRAGRIDLGQPRGSQTNLFFALANGLGIAGAHSLVHAMGGGPFSNVLLQRGIEGVQNRLAGMRLNRMVRESLNYPPEGPPPNPNPPGQFTPPSLRNPLAP